MAIGGYRQLRDFPRLGTSAGTERVSGWAMQHVRAGEKGRTRPDWNKTRLQDKAGKPAFRSVSTPR